MKAAKPKRNRSTSVLINFGTLRATLTELACEDARHTAEPPNISRSVRQLVAREAQRREKRDKTHGDD